MNIGITACPNDLFVFSPWIENKLQAPAPQNTHYLTIQELNEKALSGVFDVVKVSTFALPLLTEKYALLNAGGSFSFHGGPKFVTNCAKVPQEMVCVHGYVSEAPCDAAGAAARNAREVNGQRPFTSRRSKADALAPSEGQALNTREHIQEMTLAIPSLLSSAWGLYLLFFPRPKKIITMAPSKIIEAVAEKRVDGGLLIDEERFCFAESGLEEIADLGHCFTKRFNLPVPLGAILAKKSLGAKKIEELNKTVQQSALFAKLHYKETIDFIVQKSKKDRDLIEKHIQLFVTDETYQMSEVGRSALEAFLGRVQI